MAKIDLDRDLVVIGNIVGDHRIDDLGVTVGYDEAVRLTAKQVSKSKDLFRDIKDKKLRVDRRLYASSTKVPEKPVKPKEESLPSLPKPVAKRVTQNTSSPDLEAVKFLAAGNARTLENLTQLLGEVVSELKDMKSSVGNGVDKDTLRELLRSIQIQSGSGQDIIDTEAPRYIPSDLLGAENVVSTKVDVKSEKKKTGKLDSNLKALKELRAKKENG